MENPVQIRQSELIKKLLALDLTTTTSKMLEVCHTHIAISDNLEAMGLKEQKAVNAIQRQNKPHQGRNLHQTVCTHVDTAQSPTHLSGTNSKATAWHMPMP